MGEGVFPSPCWTAAGSDAFPYGIRAREGSAIQDRTCGSNGLASLASRSRDGSVPVRSGMYCGTGAG